MHRLYTIMVLLIAGFSLTSCVQGKLPSHPFTPTPTNTLVPTHTPTNTSTSTLTPTITNTPMPTDTPTPLPGPELITYLPKSADLPQCIYVEYHVYLTNAYLSCVPAGELFISHTANISINNKALTQADLSVDENTTPLSVPVIGQGAIAFMYKTASLTLKFYKGNTLVKIFDQSIPHGPNPTDDAVQMAQIMDKMIPDQIVPPAELTFPEKLDQDIFNQYFEKMDFAIFSLENDLIMQDKFIDIRRSQLCILPSPKIRSRNLFAAGLYNLQTQKIEAKNYIEMVGYKVCFMGPNPWPAELISGDKYELRIAVGDTLVAQFPFEIE